MELSPFQADGPEILALDVPFEIPAWWRPTGCRWNSLRRRGNRDKDGQTDTRYLKKFALEGSVESYQFGTFQSFPEGLDSQPGLICSARALFMVVECDSPDEWDKTLTGDAVPTVRSRRGYHYYYAVPEHLAGMLPTDGPVPGGDVQTKGFVPAPGTLHPSGIRYELVANRINVADEALLTRLRAARQRIRDEHVRRYREHGGDGEWTGSGGVNGQDDYLAQVVTWKAVAQGKDEHEVRETWMREAAALPLKDADDPFTEDDFQRHYRGAVRSWKEMAKHQADAKLADSSVLAWAENPGAESGSVNTPDVQPFIPPGYIIPSGFDYYNGGIGQETGTPKNPRMTQATVRPVYVSGIEIDSDGVSWYELTWDDHDGTGQKVVISSSHIANKNRLIDHFPDVVVNSNGAGAASDYLSACRRVNAKWLAEEGRTRKVALRLGWYGKDEGEGFAAGPGRPFQVRDTANLGGWLQGHQAKGSLADWTGAMAGMPPRVVLLTAAALSAPLLQVLEVNGFVVDNSGGTTQGKTRAARVAASAWGDPDRLLLSWSATKAALELYAQKSNGVPLLIDDSKLARDGEQISNLVYQVTSGLTTDRMERSADKLRGGGEIRTVLITNGETPLLTAGKGGRRDGGAVARVLELWGGPFATAEQADSVNLAIRENHGLAGEEFVKWMIATGAPELRSRYQEMRNRARALTHTDVAKRRADAAAVVMLAAGIARTARLLPAIADSEWAALLEDDAAEEGSDDMALAAMENLWNEVAHNEYIFWRDEGNSSAFLSFDRPHDGWKGRFQGDKNWIAVKPDWLDKFLAEHGYDSEGIRRQWADRNWIERDPKGKRTIAMFIGEKSRVARCVKITFKPESFTYEAGKEISEQA